MYDFYADPPETRDEIRKYLTSWLVPCNIPTPLNISGESFLPLQGFRRGFYSHTIHKSLSTGQYAWWVSEECDVKTFPTKRYSSIEFLLDSVVEDYYVLWNSRRAMNQ